MRPTMQEFYDTTIAHLVKQGRRAIGKINGYPNAVCLYRQHLDTGEVLKCAAGFHIPDDLYDLGMESNGIDTVLGKYPAVAEHFPAEDSSFMPGYALRNKLQDLHDNFFDEGPASDLFRVRVKRIAADFKLKPYNFETPDEVHLNSTQ